MQIKLPNDRRHMCLNCGARPNYWPGECPVCGYERSIIVSSKNALKIKIAVGKTKMVGDLYIDEGRKGLREVL